MLLADRRVAGLRVGDVPVAGRDLRQQREHGVAEVAVARDQLPRAAREEAVRLRVVDLAAGDRAGDRLQVGRVHLVVAGHDAGDVDSVLERPAVAGQDRGADALVLLVRDHLDARVAARAARPRPSRRARRRRRRSPGRRARGCRRCVVPIRCSSSNAGTTTATRLAVQHYSRPVRAAIGSQRSAAKRPMISPIRPATTTELRGLRAVAFAATPRSRSRAAARPAPRAPAAAAPGAGPARAFRAAAPSSGAACRG